MRTPTLAIAFLAVLLTACGGDTSDTGSSSSSATVIDLESSAAGFLNGLSSIDGTWNLYRDGALGISLKLPKTAAGIDGMAPVSASVDADGHLIIGTQGQPNPSWNITVKDVSAGQLDAFLKATFGQGCRAGARVPTRDPNTIKIELKGDDKPIGQSQCQGLMGNPVIFVSPAGKLAYWSLTQGAQFVSDAQGTKTYDVEMLESFRFLQ